MSLQALTTPSRRTKMEIDLAIRPSLRKIRTTVQERLQPCKVIMPVSKKVLLHAYHQPRQAFCNFTLCAGASYVVYLLVRGAFAGIEVDSDSNFSDLFSANKTDRITQALTFTDADQGGQFILEAIATTCVAMNLIARTHYNKFAGEVISQSYQPYLSELLGKIELSRSATAEGKENDPSDLVQMQEELDGLYCHLKEDLEPYGQEAIELVDLQRRPVSMAGGYSSLEPVLNF